MKAFQFGRNSLQRDRKKTPVITPEAKPVRKVLPSPPIPTPPIEEKLPDPPPPMEVKLALLLSPRNACRRDCTRTA